MDTLAQVREAVSDKAALEAAIAEADIVPLLMSLVQITGRREFLERARPHIKGAWNYLQEIPPTLRAEIRAALIQALTDLAASGRPVATEPQAGLFEQMMETAVGQAVPELYRDVLMEEACFGGKDLRTVAWRQKPDPERLQGFKAVLIGAGFSGIAMAIRLQEAGIPYVVIEKNPEAGGTWLENVYPGCGVDTPCHFFSYSFEPNSEWSSFFAKQGEILGYILKCVERYGIRQHIRFGQEVERAEYDESAGVWQITTRAADGQTARLSANVMISAVGALNRPSIPAIPGLGDFAGKQFHTASWDRSVDLAGKRVAMIGTGASGMQVAPTIAPVVEQLTIFQRTPHWAIRHPLYHADVAPGVRWAMRHIPFYASWFRFQLFWAASDGFHATLQMDPDWPHPERSLNAANEAMRKDLVAYVTAELGDRTDLLAKVIPNYPPFGKRMLRDNNWYRMLRRANVELVTGGVERVDADAVVAGGQRYAADVIVLATGFQAARMLSPMDIRGRDGASLRDRWGEDNPRAHLGVTVPGFPNFFLIYGPNTNLAHGGSAIFHSECQVRYIMQAIRELIETKSRSIEVREAPFLDYNDRVDAAHKQMVWSHPGVGNWYKNKNGRVVMNSPWRLVDYRHMTATFAPEEYELTAEAG
jgi:4-hydroxyacetophenone monooxygenase